MLRWLNEARRPRSPLLPTAINVRALIRADRAALASRRLGLLLPLQPALDLREDRAVRHRRGAGRTSLDLLQPGPRLIDAKRVGLQSDCQGTFEDLQSVFERVSGHALLGHTQAQ